MKNIVVVTVVAVLSFGGSALANPGVEPKPKIPTNYDEPFGAPTETNSGKYFPGADGTGVFAGAFFAITNTNTENRAGITYLTVVGENGDFVELSASIDAPDVVDRTVDRQLQVQRDAVTVTLRVGPAASTPEAVGVLGCKAKAKTKVLDAETQDYVKGIFVVSCPQDSIDFAPLNDVEQAMLAEILGTRPDGTGFTAKVKVKRAVPAGQANPLVP